MTLEDFFTLTEMKDGLSSLGRVEELVAVMQKQKDCVLSTMGDSARQWSTVASTLAASENKDCLDHFVHLNGLFFINQWLQEARKCTKDVCGAGMKELIYALLTALERLPIDKEKSISTGIGSTIEQLLGHESCNIKDRAKRLFDNWNSAIIDDAKHQDLEGDGACPNDQPKPLSCLTATDKSACLDTDLDTATCERGIEQGSNVVESPGTESHHSNVTRCYDTSQVDTTNDGKNSITNQSLPAISSNSVVAVGDVNSVGSSSSLVSNSCHENMTITEESSVCPAVGFASAGTCSNPTVQEQGTNQHDVSIFRDVNDGAEEMDAEMNTKESCPSSFAQKETCNASSSSSLSTPIPVVATESQPANFNSKGNESCISKTTDPQANGAAVNFAMPDYLTLSHLERLSSSGAFLRKVNGPETSLKQTEAAESASDTEELGSSDADMKLSAGPDIGIHSHSSKVEESRSAGEMDQRSAMGLDYEEIDALEVARQVAIEVEREVVDYREPFCSSPEVNSGETTADHSPGFVQEMQDQLMPVIEDGNRSPNKNDISDNASSRKDDSGIPENVNTSNGEPEKTFNSPNLTTVPQEPDEGQFDKKVCDFDLNEDICIEQLDCTLYPVPNVPVSISAPVAVVATSRGAPVVPVAPLHFEGELGWRGSAATSAFRPASPRKTPDAEKSNSGVKQKRNFIGFDLNVAENEDGVPVVQTSVRQIPVSSGLPSGESSVEVNSRREERLKLDLNRLSDEDTSVYPASNWRLHYQNGDQSLSSASSSCSKQPSMRDFDLNDNPPSLFDAGNSLHIDKSSKLDPGVMIMGSRMPPESKDYARQPQHSVFSHGLSMESMMPARQVLPYPQMMPHAYGYNGLPAGPSMSIHSPLYGPGNIPYHMVDSRGFTVIPQVLGTSLSRPPFFMNSTGAHSSLNGVGTSRPSLDLNSGMTPPESGSREGGSFRHLFMPGYGDLMEGQARTTSQPSSSGIGMKRKEPECGRESYQLGYKQVTSWQ